MKHGHIGRKHKSGKMPSRHAMMGHMDGTGKKDPHAHPSHNQANSAAGMSAGMSPQGGYDDGDESSSEGMGEQNCEEC